MTPATLTSDDIVVDTALTTGDLDRFDHRVIAERVAELALAADPPTNIALFGPWGSGKSSFYRLMQEAIEARQPETEVVRYDAWKFGGHALKKNFLISVGRQLSSVDDRKIDAEVNASSETSHMDWWQFLSSDYKVVTTPVLLSLVAAALWTLLTFLVHLATSDASNTVIFKAAAETGLKVFGGTLVALVLGEKLFERGVTKTVREPISSDDAFSDAFRMMIEKHVGKDERLVVFIDELDRCSPEDVVATLIDLKTFLDEKRCVFVVAADREVIERALDKLPQITPVRADEPYYSTAGAFLDKIFQHQIALPPLRSGTLTHFARGLVAGKAGVWGDMAAVDPGLRDTVIYALVPAHVRSPRRVKVLLNNFATNARIAEARGLSWLQRAPEIAKLTVLETEFPEVAAALLHEPRLLGFLLDPPTEQSEALAALLARFALPSEPVTEDDADHDDDDEDDDEELPTGAREPSAATLIGQAADAGGARQQVQRALAGGRLNQELHRYLSKTRRLPNPQPDLLYLQVAGHVDGIVDPELGRVLDEAADTDASAVAAAFESSGSSLRLAAAQHLTLRADTDFGPGQVNLLEIACRLARSLDPDDLVSLAPRLVESLLAIAPSELGARTAMLPGALAAACLAGDEDLTTALTSLVEDLDDLAAQPNEDEGVLQALLPLLGVLTAPARAVVGAKIASTYATHPESLQSAVRDLPDDVAAALLEDNAGGLRRALRALVVPEVAGVPATPTTAAVAKVPADARAAGERFERLLAYADERGEAAPLTLTALLRLGASCAIGPVQDVTLRRLPNILDRLGTPKARNHVILYGLAHALARNVAAWMSHLDDSDPISDEEAVSGAVGNLLSKVTHLPDGELAKLAGHVARLQQRAGDSALSASVRSAIDKAIEEQELDDGATDPAWPPWLALVATLSRLAAFDPSGDIDEKAGGMVADAYAELTRTETTMANVILGARSLTSAAATHLVELLEEAEPTDTTADPADPADPANRRAEASTDLALRLAALQVCKGPAPDVAQLLAVPAKDAPDLLLIWLSLCPDATEALQAFEDIDVPATEALSAYASALDDAARSELWRGLRSLDADEPALRAAAMSGVDAQVLRELHEELQAKPPYDDRAVLVRQAQTLPLANAPLRIEATAMTVTLLELDLGQDLVLAANLILAADGAPAGAILSTKAAFDGVVTKHPKSLTDGSKSKLIAKNLLSKPSKQKNIVERAVDRFLPG